MKKLNQILNIAMGTFAGIFIGHSIYKFWDYKAHPDLYAMQSAPWHTSVLIYGIFTIIVLLIVVLLKLIIKKYTK